MRNQGTTMTRLLFVLQALATVLATTKQEYCQLCANHTMCITPDMGASCGGKFYSQGVPQNQQTIVVNEHNRCRNQVALGSETRGNPGPQPGASNMNALVWDAELATVAQRWANQCTFKHDSCRSVPRYSWVGQNLYMLTWSVGCDRVSYAADWPAAVKAWYDEVTMFPNSSVKKYVFGENYGHYSQLVWATTKYLGCGFSVFQNANECKLFYACNYGPGGNIISQPVYNTGNARADCPNTPMNSAYPGLCS